ncbi:uncharacterized protein [Ptychodera flava]|uniref:uncharacterized protein n=1 Tax=Ptychodera flava TaxID=63121 RepID=UPI00396A1061
MDFRVISANRYNVIIILFVIIQMVRVAESTVCTEDSDCSEYWYLGLTRCCVVYGIGTCCDEDTWRDNGGDDLGEDVKDAFEFGLNLILGIVFGTIALIIVIIIICVVACVCCSKSSGRTTTTVSHNQVGMAPVQTTQTVSTGATYGGAVQQPPAYPAQQTTTGAYQPPPPPVYLSKN